MDHVITSRDNGQVKLLVSLMTQKKRRDATGLFAAEGERLCRDALSGGVRPQTLLFTPRAAERYPELARHAGDRAQTLLLSEELAGRVAQTASPQGVFGIFAQQDHSSRQVGLDGVGRYLLLAGLQDPGNFGSVLRTAAALGVDGVLAAACPDLYSPKVLRASMGALWRLPVAVLPDMGDMVAYARGRGIRVYAAALREEAVPLGAFRFSGGCGVLVGNEGSGLEDALVDACDGCVVIPMAGGSDSLNAACAASILLWEMTK